MKKRNNIALMLLLLTVTIATLYFLTLAGPLTRNTGMDISQQGIATIKFQRITPPPQPSMGGGGGEQTECCEYTTYNSMEYECDCYIYDYNVIKMQPTICCENPTNPKCLPFCSPIQRPALPPAKGVCPIEQTCGQKCCNQGELCRNGQCLKELPASPIELPQPRLEEPYLVAIPYTEYAFPWWYFVSTITVMLILTYFLLKHGKEPLKQQPAPKKRRLI